MPRLRPAFTLIELLVVIAIIAILAAILFPVFAQAREKAKQSTCTSNMKQIGISLMMYTQDYDETYPTNSWDLAPVGTTDSDSGNPNYRTRFNWIWQLLPYTKNRQIWRCPSDPNPKGNGSCYSASPRSPRTHTQASTRSPDCAAGSPSSCVLGFPSGSWSRPGGLDRVKPTCCVSIRGCTPKIW